MPDKVWRLIDSGCCSAFYNMALDEALVTAHAERPRPTLRLYGWSAPSVSLGRFQPVGDIDMPYCDRAGIAVVRRPTGGRAILHGYELTYGFSAGTVDGIFRGDLFESYRKLGDAFNHAFLSVGLPSDMHADRGATGQRSPACFHAASFGELTAGGKKFIGSAQRRWPDRFLQQGSIPIMLDWDWMQRIFGHGDYRRRMAGLGEFLPGLTAGQMKAALVASFEEVFGIRFELTRPTPLEEAEALRLLDVKYRQARWNRHPEGRRRSL